MKDARAERIEVLITPSVESLGFDLVGIQISGGSRAPLVRVYIDSEGGITVDDCARVSRQVGAVLEVEDPLPGAYTLEVSSPGLDRLLMKPADFERYLGRQVKVRMDLAVLGRKNFKGDLVEVAADYAVVEVDNESYDLPFEHMESARLAPDS